jgi:hypothetical protein
VIGLCWQLDPVGDRRRWVLRLSLNECGDGAVFMWLRRVPRGQCSGCGLARRWLLVPEEAGPGTLGRCQRCVIVYVQQVFQEEWALSMASPKRMREQRNA